jgi:phosphoribosylaminoimidazolecarboxamide formyltransferase / IMP cyclohydrolase
MTGGCGVPQGSMTEKADRLGKKSRGLAFLFCKKEYLVMNEMQLKYGCNPNQTPARIFIKNGELPIEVMNGRPGYINLLDALNGWQLVTELKKATGLPAAASFKHVSPAGAAVGTSINESIQKICFVDDMELSPLASAYAKARGADRMSSYGDFIALSDICDVPTAKLIAREVSDGIIAPGYDEQALAILKSKRKGNYTIIQIDGTYRPDPIEQKDVFGVTFEQCRNEVEISEVLLQNIPTENKKIPQSAKMDLIISLITLKYTQSNSVCYVKDGQAIGIGAGQQSRIHCTRLAGDKADKWYLRQNPYVLNLPFKENIRRPDRDNAIDVFLSDDYEDVLSDGCWEVLFKEKPEPLTRADRKEWIKTLHGVSVGSDAFFPFGDNIERAYRSGAEYIAQTGGSIRDDNVIETCDKYHIAMAFTGVRLFHH